LGLRVFVLSLFLVALFWTAAFLLLTVASWLTGGALAGSGLLLRCTVCGLIAALFVAVFHLKKEVVLLRLADRQAFAEQLRAELKELGYVPTVERRDRLVFRPALRSFLFGAGIYVQVGDERATVTGPRVHVEQLRRRLRLHDFLDRPDRVTGARGKRLLRRTELSLRASPQQLAAVAAGLAALRAGGAEVVCQVHVLAWNDAGIPEAALDERVRDWQERHALTVGVSREPLALVRPRRKAETLAAEDSKDSVLLPASAAG
jgi:hypothetical protein